MTGAREAPFFFAMDIIFVRKGEYKKGDEAFPLIKQAARIYLDREQDQDLPEIERTPKGRLYFSGSDLDLSVTHSGDIWMCLISDGRCGIDFQYMRKAAQPDIAERYYAEGEKEYLENGMAGPYVGRSLGPGERPDRFFDIWTRREALGKYEGSGFFGKYPDSAPGGIPAESLVFSGGERVYVHEITHEMLSLSGIETESEFRAAAVTGSEIPPEIRKI